MVNTSGSYHAAIGGKKMKGKSKPKMMAKGKTKPVMHGQQKVPDFAIAKGSMVRKKKGTR
jgi:hypothetical protein